MENGNDEVKDTRAFGSTPEVEPETNDKGEVVASEEEQQAYDMVVSRGIKIIYGQGKDDILKLMGASESPGQGMGRVVANIVSVIYNQAKENGKEVPDDVLMHAGFELIQELSEYGTTKGVFEYENDKEEEQEIQDAVMWATKYFGESQQAAGKITPEMKQQAGMQVQKGLEEEQGPAEPAPEDNVGIINSISGGDDGVD